MSDAKTRDALVARLSAARKRLGAGVGREAVALEPVPREGDLPLSFAQQRLWFLDRLLPGASTYNMPVAWRLQGPLEVGALARSVTAVVARHESLRTRVALRGGTPMQVIDPAPPEALLLTDLRSLEPAAREARTQALVEAHARQPFDLVEGPLFHAQLLCLAADEHVLLVNVHHIASDGWSMGVFRRELGTAYGACVLGTEPVFPALPIQYADYAVWQRAWLQGPVLAAQRAYWQRQLADLRPLELPTDRARPLLPSHQGAQLALDLPAPLTAALKDLGRAEGATLFMTLLAAFQVLLFRYSGQTDIAVGSPIAGRGRHELEGLIGFFVNTLVLRSDLSGDPSFRALLARVRDTALEAYTHQDLPFEKLVEDLAPTRDLSRQPLFQVMFVLQNMPGAPLALDGVAVSRLSRETESAKFDLTLSVRESAKRLSVSWSYATDLFDAATIARMAGHFQVLLEGVVADPDQAVGQLPLITEAERQQLLIAWNDTATEDPRAGCIQQLVEAQVARSPDAVAVVDDDRQLTYSELNARANQLAHQLITLGVGPEVMVAICVERSLDLIVGLLGILKAGGAYVPLDPSYPTARLEFMIVDAHAPVLLTQQAFLAQLPPFDGHLLCLDRDEPIIAAQPATDPACRTTAESLAYVIYTSGSTGTPKGVAIEHRSTVTFLQWAAGVFSDQELAGTLFSTSICFDLSVFELFAPLSRGAAVIVAENALQLPLLFHAGRVTLINTVPSAMTELLRMRGVPASVRAVNLAGERLPGSLVHSIYDGTQVEKLYNLYGPTEDTTYSTCALLVRGGTETPTIGRPIANTQVRALDRYLSPVPIGVTGELYLGGAGLARGYLNRPELTAEKFVADPFSTVPGARMYRTGDRVRYLANGDLEFLGRLDDQVKIRGFRIELGEIEAVLGEHPAVRQAVVLAREDTPGDKRLVAYVVSADAAGPDLESLRTFLRERLPEYMRPAAYVVLAELPLTPTGKLDRRALPAPQYGGGAAADSFVAPRDALEEAVAEVWREVLKLDRVGVYDNFFELGGHSLLATQVLARLARVLKVELSLRGFFESPTVSALAAAAQQRLGVGVDREAIALEPVWRGEDLPLSFAQQRLWFLDQLLPGASTYNMPTAWRLQGPLEVAALARSVTAVVARHESLRTRVVLRGGAPVQVIDPARPEVLLLTDLGALAPAAREAHAQTLVEAHARQPFDLAAGPLFRAQLLCLAADEHVLLVNVHHIASDGWSSGVFGRELSAAYGAFVEGREPTLPALPIQYADYAVWQRAWLQGPVLAAQRAYWQRQLADLHPLELPTDRPRPPVARHQGAHFAVGLPVPLTAALKDLGRREGTTLFMTLLAAFQVLLSRCSGQTDIAVGSPIAGRGRPQLEGLIGFFVNTLVLRSDLSGNPSFRKLLARVRDTALEAYTHQDLPFEKLVEELAPTRDLSRQPLFQVMFVLQNMPGAPLALDGVAVSRLSRETESAKFDLTLSARESAAGMHLRWEYSTDLFDAATIARLAGHFQVLLEAIMTDPEEAIGQLPLLTKAERHQLLVEWNDTAADYPRDRCIHQLVEDQAARTPEAVGIVYEDHHLTYAELNARANQLAHHLIALGVGPEVLVGICVERSLDLIVGLLGILKAGGAYVPLDPSYPKTRVAFMLSDTQTPVLVTQQALLTQLPPFDGHVLCLDRDATAMAAQPDTNPRCAATADTLAYVMHTSGSTGMPKGVAVRHRGITRLVCNTDYVEFETTDCVAQIANPAFDAATFEIWGALVNGASLDIIPRDVALDLPRLADELRHRGVSTMFLTTTLFNEVIRERAEAFTGMKQLLVGGEALDPHWVGECLRAGGPQRLLNGYGPTECTTFATWHPVQAVAAGARTVPIGRPISNTVAYVLDRYLHPMPIGVTGELYLGGDGLARGYWNRPELTMEKFVPDPFSATPGARMYRTGDRVRYLVNGDLEFLGRLDDQVKIRGFRIELGEIEAVLGEHPAVRQAVVLAREDTPGDKRLVAYVVSADAAGPDPESLRTFLRERLPEYMRPAAYVVLAELPLTPTGKLDRRALPAPQYGGGAAADSFVAPRDALEEAIAEVWREVLRVEQVGVRDNFFELGGHSLLATQVLARLGPLLQVELSLHGFFESPTVSALAAAAQQRLGVGVDREAVALEPVSRGEDLPLSFAQQRLWFLDQLLPGASTYNMPTAWRLQGPLDVAALARSVAAVVARHESLRTRVVLRGGAPVQVIDPSPSEELVLTDVSALVPAAREAHAQTLVEAHARQPFDLAQGPLFHAQVLRLTADEHVLLVNVHHIASDGWSVGVFHRELAAAYGAFVRGTEPVFPPLPIQYADYAVWQRTWLEGPVLETQRAYWRRQLADLRPLELPTDRPRPPVARHQGAHLATDVPAVVTAALKALGRGEGATLFMTLLAAFQVLLFRHSGQTDIAVGSPIAGRGRHELEGLIGFFVNTLVLRSDLSGNPSFRELLARVRDTALGAYTRQDLPFEKLVEELAPTRDRSRHPLFQVMFVLQNMPGAPLALDGVVVSRLSRETQSAKFDLTLSVRESTTGLRLHWEYARDLFEAATIERLAGHFQVLLEAIVADPVRRIQDLPLLTEAERHQMLVAWNNTATDYPRSRCVHELVEAQVARTPDAVAVVDDNRELTYTELNARANRLAHRLIALGVGPEVLVGICLERSVDVVVGLLGILKAGGAYVPLDPSYPAARVAFMLTDTHAPVLVTQQALLAQLPPFDGHLLCLDRDAPTIAAQPATDPACCTTAESPAYVIHTSGSTGRPKGVAIPHRAVVNLLTSMARKPGLGPDDVLVAVTTLSFDIAVLELQLPLTVGATVVIATRVCAMDGHALSALLEQHRATALQATPATWRLLLETGWSGATLCKALVGGEAMAPDLAERLITAGVELWNMYGPTETTVWSTCAHITDTSKAITIGKPIANTRVWIMDAHQGLCPIGVPGELFIGGDGVALGYWHRSELTAEKFLPDPFSAVPGARMYRTGDRVRYLANGDLEFLGRLDDQVKVRGFRIELGEIEAVLGEHPAVRQTVALAREDTPGDTRLVAYVVPVNPTAFDVDLLRTSLRARLPDYMQPAAFVVLDQLPLTPAGKLDRRALPVPQYGRAADAFVAPRDSVEEAIAEVWREVLRVEQVGVHDNFFELGGHSLLAAQVLARLARVLQTELSLHGFFESPTVSALAVAAQQQRLAAGAGRETVGLDPVSRGGDLPLSFAQQRLWFLDRFQPGASTYNMPTAWRLQGPIDVGVLDRSLGAVVARHESLRTRMTLRGGAPVQVIDPTPSEVLVLTDISTLEPAAREVRAQALIENHARRPFDLAEGPLFRAEVLRLAADEHVLLVNVHHIVSDGWSVGVFHRELAAAYGAFARGTEPVLPSLPIQYADYAVWQRAWLQGPVLAAQRAYWRRQLADLQPLELPTDRARPPVPSHHGAYLAVDLPAGVTAALKALGRVEGATLFMTLLAAFQVLLSRYSGQTDIAVGSPIAGRGRPEVEGLIGFFVNTLVLRSDLSDDPSFRELLTRVRNTSLEAYTHQDLPFEKLVEELAPARDLSRQPLFQVMFVLQNAPGAPLALEGVTVSRLPRETESAKLDLTLSVRESAGGLRLHWEYASDLFEASTIARLTGHFQVLLAAIVADPDEAIGQLPLLTEAERHQVLAAWNNTATDYPRDHCVHQLFEAQVARAPDAVAVVDDGHELTYAELNARANQLAHHLIALGVGPEVPVGVCVERSLDLIVGLLGILKAGGAYVPLDPSYPKARVAFMLSDTQTPVLVTQQAILTQLPPFDGHVLCLDLDTNAMAAQPDTNPCCAATAETLAYVMYTSGSTGTPKGVAVRHRGITRLVCNTDYVEFATTDCVAHISNPAFDAATFEIWGALTNGASLAIIPRDVALDLPRLAEELRHRGVSTMFLTTTLFNEVVRDRAGAFVGLRQLVVGGEALDPHWVGACLRAGGPKRLLNGYGPTECTTFATSYLVEAVEPGARTIPIGRPIANTVTYVLDRNRQPVPIGVAGELHIGGAGLARGYWNRPELTTEKFVPDPFSATPGARMYRTGDRVRYLVNGDLEFLGRFDDQVKIRGFRIELGEIEAVLGEHPTVRQAVVLAREDTPGEKRLVAYVVPAHSAAADIEALRTFLRARLPDYMRPSAFVALEQLPLTATGKLDRRALPAPSRGLEDATRVYELPRDEVERTLCQLWTEVLNTSHVGIDDDFFKLGGHSLLAAQLFARMDQTFGRSLPLATLFDAPTVRALARFYRDGAEPTMGTALVPITASGSQLRIFAVPGVGGNVIGFTTLARDLGPEQPFFGLQSVGLDGAREPLESIEQMASHYLREVRETQPRGPYLLLGACFGATVAFEMTRQLLDAGEEVAFLGLFDPSSLGGDLAGQLALPLPTWLKRGTDLARFVASRLWLYVTQMRSLGYRQKVQLVGSKLKLVAEIVDKRDLLRGDHRKFHQRRVSAANLRALRRYKHEPLHGGPEVIEIFRSGCRVTRTGVDWSSLAGKSITYHSVPGKNSGDMLQGENGKALASLLSIRLQQARRP